MPNFRQVRYLLKIQWLLVHRGQLSSWVGGGGWDLDSKGGFALMVMVALFAKRNRYKAWLVKNAPCTSINFISPQSVPSVSNDLPCRKWQTLRCESFGWHPLRPDKKYLAPFLVWLHIFIFIANNMAWSWWRFFFREEFSGLRQAHDHSQACPTATVTPALVGSPATSQWPWDFGHQQAWGISWHTVSTSLRLEWLPASPALCVCWHWAHVCDDFWKSRLTGSEANCRLMWLHCW